MFSLFKKLGWFFSAYKTKYIWGLVTLTLVRMVEILPPLLIGLALDDIHTGVLTSSLLLYYVIALLLTTAVAYVGGYVFLYQLYGGSLRLEASLRFKFVNQILKMKPHFFQKFRTGDLMARATNDLGAVTEASGFGVLTLFDATLYMVVILAMMIFTVSWRLTLIAVAPLPIYAYLVTKMGKVYDKRYAASQKAFSNLNNKVLESILGMRVIRAYVQEKEEIDRFAKLAALVCDKNRQIEALEALFEPAGRWLMGLCFFITIFYGSHLILAGQMTLGSLVTFNVYLSMLTWPIFAISVLINVMQRGKTSLERIHEALDAPIDVVDQAETNQVGIPEVIAIKALNFTYPDAPNEALTDITLTINRGETIGIVGKTGSGKTTLLRQFLREYPLESGKIVVNGLPLESLKQKEVLSWIGYVPQEHILFSKSVRENILYGVDEAREADLARVIQLAALTDDLEFFTDGLDTIVGEKGIALSGGQKQRISIARAMATHPEILILDDALSAVDAKTETSIVENIRKERGALHSNMGKTTIITAHRLSAVVHADQIIVLEDGKISQMGTHDALMAAGGWYKEQYEHQNLQLGGAEDE